MAANVLHDMYQDRRKTKRDPERLNAREEMRERAAAKKFWQGLHSSDRWELGDQLVLGEFDWRDWFTKKPSRAFMREVDELRMLWET